MYKLDIEVYAEWGENHWAQAKYLVRGHDDVLWTNNLNEAIKFLKASLVAVS
jgi:hypothetical protein